jgi:hypothetical protein
MILIKEILCYKPLYLVFERMNNEEKRVFSSTEIKFRMSVCGNALIGFIDYRLGQKEHSR